MLNFFAEKNVSSFSTAKATHIFSAKNIRILYIEPAKTSWVGGGLTSYIWHSTDVRAE